MSGAESATNAQGAAKPAYRGRFAPTPSGPLHLGSLLAALASYLDARRRSGAWLLRIDDLDGPRCAPGADSEILRQLEAHGLYWDETPRYQSEHLDSYHAALSRLQGANCLYACACTRAALADNSLTGPDGPVYAGTCRELNLPAAGKALRFRVPAATRVLNDLLDGRIRRDTQRDVGDFVVRRRDGIIGYHLACAIDEAAMGITDVIRGADLLNASFAQRELARALDLPNVRYGHVPLLHDSQGRKLSKQNHAAPIQAENAGDNLWHCLVVLNQHPPPVLRQAPAGTLLAWARGHWQRDAAAGSVRSAVETPAQVWHDAPQQSPAARSDV